jgi:glycosyl transferase family 25
MTTISVKVISLPESTERRAAVARSLASFPLPWTFFDGLTGAAETGLAYDEARALKYFGRPLSRNELGCFKSHYTVMTTLLSDADAEWLIVFEDDLIVDPAFDFKAAVAYMAANGIDCLRLYCRRWKNASVVGALSHRQVLRFHTDPYGIQSYIMNKKAAAAITANIVDIRRPVDDEIGRFWEHGVQIFGLFPFPVLETSVPSTLEASRVQAARRTGGGLVHQAARLWLRSLDKAGKTLYNLASPALPGMTLPPVFRD